MTKDRIKLAVNYLLFQTGWFLCVVGTDSIALYVTCTILFIHFITIGNWREEKETLAVCLLLGSAVDSFLGNLDILQFNNDGRILPVWLACIWVLLGTTIKHSLSWVGKNRYIGALLGFIGGPAAYVGMAQLTDMHLAEPLWQTLLILAILWAIIIPLLQAFSQAWQKRLG
ncbi:hypothetical protein ACH42_07570 [Endozoicomonas sp. (ex Bugula neritina AB1)]|nr:hypothetical protein ACH42_07570 [Endozoicomonas sp. (ex Bugula neritina AB1)]